MEIVNIEAGTFGRMNAALEELVGKLQSERKDKEYGLEEWLDNQDVCRLLDISPSKLTAKYSTSGKTSENLSSGNYRNKEKHDYGTHTAKQ